MTSGAQDFFRGLCGANSIATLMNESELPPLLMNPQTLIRIVLADVVQCVEVHE